MFILRRASAISGRYVKSIFNYRTMSTFPHIDETPYEKATFGMGCFWASDSLYGGTEGVLRTAVGYAGGKMDIPTYKNIGDHTEVIEIHYNPKVINYDNLLQLFWDNHEYGLTTKIKRQYMSLILYHSDEQKAIAEKSMKEQAAQRNVKLITEIAPAKTFYPAEDYHQKYRLQGHSWICDALKLNSELLQKSVIAAKLNGYLVGLGKEAKMNSDLKKFEFNEKMVEYVRKYWTSNKGGSLFC